MTELEAAYNREKFSRSVNFDDFKAGFEAARRSPASPAVQPPADPVELGNAIYQAVRSTGFATHSQSWSITEAVLLAVAASTVPAAPAEPTDLSKQLRERATGGYCAVCKDDEDLMLAAADEIERLQSIAQASPARAAGTVVPNTKVQLPESSANGDNTCDFLGALFEFTRKETKAYGDARAEAVALAYESNLAQLRDQLVKAEARAEEARREAEETIERRDATIARLRTEIERTMKIVRGLETQRTASGDAVAWGEWKVSPCGMYATREPVAEAAAQADDGLLAELKLDQRSAEILAAMPAWKRDLWNEHSAAPTAQPTLAQVADEVERSLAQDVAQPTLPGDELPPLPEPRAIRAGQSFPKVYALAYTADMMREYARAALRQPGALPDEAEDAALERAAKICDEIHADWRARYKGRAPHEPMNPHRADPHADGVSDGACQCADKIRELKSTAVKEAK